MEGAARLIARGFWVALLPIAGCNGTDTNALQNEFEQRDVDPALTSVLEDQIMIDPTLSQQANEDAIRPPDRPADLLVPKLGGVEPPALPTLGRAIGDAAKLPQFAGCATDVRYSFIWATRLPAELALPAKARVTEAAGSDHTECALRAVSFTSPVARNEVVAYYRTLAGRGGYSAKASDEAVISAVRAKDGAAFSVVFQPVKDGVSVDLVSNRGR